MKKRNFAITIFFAVIASLSNAQSHNEEITIKGSYIPQIQKSERIAKTPNTTDNTFVIPKYEVNTEDFNYNHKIDLEPVSPLTYINNKTDNITNNFIKAGIGTRLSPDFLFRHYSNLSKNMSLGIGVIHNSTWLDIKEFQDTKYMNNAFSISASNRFSRFQLHSFIDYHFDKYYLRPTADTINIQSPVEKSKRNIHSLNIKLLANNNQTSYKSIYDEFLLDYTFSGIQEGIQENLVRFKAHAEYSDSWFRNSDGIQTLAADINADIDNISQTLFIIAANPYLAFDGEYYKLHLGFRVDAKTNSTSMGSIYPDIKGSLYLFKRNLEFYASLGGKTKINTLKDILAENPFIVSDLTNIGEFDYEKTKLDFQGGLKFKVLNKVNANVGIRYRNIDNMVFYVSSMNDDGTFNILLNNCNVLNFNTNIHLKLREDIKIAADFSYNKYDINPNKLTDDAPVTEAHAWYKPELEFTLKGEYSLNKLWDFNIATYVEGRRYALTGDGYKDIKELRPICDIQLGCDYNFKDDLSFYGEIKNLIHNKYQMYYGYPSYGFQMFLGFKYRF